MSWGRSSYIDGSSTYIEHKLVGYFSEHVGYKRTDDLLLSTYVVGNGTSNTMLEGDNERVDEKEDASAKEGGTNANEELKPEPIRQRNSNGLKVALFLEPNSITTELKHCESDDDDSDLDVRSRAYEPLHYMTNIDLSSRVV